MAHFIESLIGITFVILFVLTLILVFIGIPILILIIIYHVISFFNSRKNKNISVNKNSYKPIKQSVTEPIKQEIKQKIDLNNCTEKEIEELPAISIIQAKRIIKKREEIGGFKSVDDVFLFLKLSEHIKNNLINLICVNPIKQLDIQSKNDERNIDL